MTLFSRCKSMTCSMDIELAACPGVFIIIYVASYDPGEVGQKGEGAACAHFDNLKLNSLFGIFLDIFGSHHPALNSQFNPH